MECRPAKTGTTSSRERDGIMGYRPAKFEMSRFNERVLVLMNKYYAAGLKKSCLAVDGIMECRFVTTETSSISERLVAKE